MGEVFGGTKEPPYVPGRYTTETRKGEAGRKEGVKRGAEGKRKGKKRRMLS